MANLAKNLIKGFMKGHVLLISKDAPFAHQWSQFTADWLEKHGVDPNPIVYVCNDFSLAQKSIEIPLSIAQPPALVIIDHQLNDQDASIFSKKLRDCIPESWILDLVDRDNTLPIQFESAHIISKPVHEDDWNEFFHMMFFQAANPQWSKSLILEP